MNPPHGPVVGVKREASPRVCAKCGRRAAAVGTRDRGKHVSRRYACKCGERWTNYEVRKETVEAWIA